MDADGLGSAAFESLLPASDYDSHDLLGKAKSSRLGKFPFREKTSPVAVGTKPPSRIGQHSLPVLIPSRPTLRSLSKWQLAMFRFLSVSPSDPFPVVSITCKSYYQLFVDLIPEQLHCALTFAPSFGALV